ncbi:TPA: glycosyltransferase [Vibrio vulnificus]|nr:glycosyltransferase family 2 protein [Vibrio vulnificus]HAS6158945.1 glycosyltransferase [Vibrio vulnificus]HAS6282156.1 glycosyltransferase [Vibrio vulnificus]HAS6302591.1 glycosyltransferase [Vibrio vulnificus]
MSCLKDKLYLESIKLKIGFVFTNYNNTKYTELALESISKSDSSEAPVVIVDNSSESNCITELTKVCERFENAYLILNDENIGYFKGLNTGIAQGRKQFPEVDYWIIGNNDLSFPSNFKQQIEKCIDTLCDYPVIAPNIRTLDGVPQNPHVISRISKIREFVYDLYYSNFYLAMLIKKLADMTHSVTDRDDESFHETAMEIYQGYGACYILTPLFFKHFDELWSPTFLMYEEYFLSKQLKDKGFKTYYEPTIKIEHHWHATTFELPKKRYWELAREAHKEYRKYVKVWSKEY